MKKKLIALFLWLAVFCLPGILQAYGLLPLMISYQGRLVDRFNVPITATINIDFRIYDVATGGAAIWGPETQSVSIVRGVFNVQLGSLSSLSALTFDKPYWLDVSIGGVSMAPRRPLLSSPYSLIAGSVVTNSITSNMIRRQNITSTNIKNNTIRNMDLASDTNSLKKVSGGLMYASNNSIYVGTGTNAPFTPMYVDGPVIISFSNVLQFTSDRTGPKIDLGANAAVSKWFGIDNSGQWYMSFSDDAGFRWYNSGGAGKTWGTAIMDLTTEGISFPDAQKHRINLGNNAGKAKWIGIDGGWYQAHASDNGYKWYISNGNTSWGTNVMKLDQAGNISNSGYRSGTYSDYVIIPFSCPNGGNWQSTGSTAALLWGSLILYPTMFRGDNKVDINLFVLGHSATGGNTQFARWSLIDNQSGVNKWNLSSDSGNNWEFQSSGWFQWDMGGAARLDLYWYTDNAGDANWTSMAYIAVRPRP
jgi:hypothetical protein